MKYKSLTQGLPRDTMSYLERLRREEERGRIEEGTYAEVSKGVGYISIYDTKRFKVH